MYARVEKGEVIEWGTPSSVTIRRPAQTLQVERPVFENGEQVYKRGKPEMKVYDLPVEESYVVVSNPDEDQMRAAGWVPVIDEEVPHDFRGNDVLVQGHQVVRRVRQPNAQPQVRAARLAALRKKETARTAEETAELVDILSDIVLPPVQS